MPGNIPHDIVIDILLKLPVKSLLRFKPVCKLWRSLIEDPQFIKQQHYQKIFLACFKDRYYSIDAPHKHDSAVSLMEPPPGINHSLRKIFINSCNGLFLLSSFAPENKIVLWNPALRESRTIPSPIPIWGRTIPSPIPIWGRSQYYSEYGLGYVSSLNDYNIVRVGHDVQIFSTKSDSWKLIDNLPVNFTAYIEDIVVADGIAYIILQKQSPRSYIIISLCLKNENFKEISFPDSDIDIETNNVSLYAVGESLLAMFWTKISKEKVDFEVWCLEKDGLMNWRKILAIKEPGPVSFEKNDGMLFFSWDKFEYMVYDFKSRKFKEFKVYGFGARGKLKELKFVGPAASILIHRVVPYVETLISPNEI